MFYIPDVTSHLELVQGTPQTNYNTIYKGWSQARENYDPQQPWVAVDSLTKEIMNPNVEQPEPGRLVLHAGITRFGRVRYWYYDDVPHWYQRVFVLAVVFAIIATPLSLLCFIPAMEHLKKVHMLCKLC